MLKIGYMSIVVQDVCTVFVFFSIYRFAYNCQQEDNRDMFLQNLEIAILLTVLNRINISPQKFASGKNKTFANITPLIVLTNGIVDNTESSYALVHARASVSFQ